MRKHQTDNDYPPLQILVSLSDFYISFDVIKCLDVMTYPKDISFTPWNIF